MSKSENQVDKTPVFAVTPLDGGSLKRLDLALTLAGFGAAARKEILARVDKHQPIIVKNGPQATGKTVLFELLDSYAACVYEDDDEGVLYIHAADKCVSFELKDETLLIGETRPLSREQNEIENGPYLGSKGTGGDIDNPIIDITNRSPHLLTFTLKDLAEEYPGLLNRNIKTVKLCEAMDPVRNAGQRLVIEFEPEGKQNDAKRITIQN